jgi:glutamine---fructose-6-phosphate transaminase (isomerizing)
MVHLIEEELAPAPSLYHAVLAAFKQLDGVNGIAVLDGNGDVLVAATSGSPMVVGVGNGEAHLASDPSVLMDGMERLIVLEDK